MLKYHLVNGELTPNKTRPYHRRAILMGVVRQEVKRSAGRSGFMGNSSLASQAASWMQFFMDGGRGIWARGWLGLMAATWTHRTPEFDSHSSDLLFCRDDDLRLREWWKICKHESVMEAWCSIMAVWYNRAVCIHPIRWRFTSVKVWVRFSDWFNCTTDWPAACGHE